MDALHSFSDELEAWLSGDKPKTLGALGETFSEKSFAVTILLLMFVPAAAAHRRHHARLRGHHRFHRPADGARAPHDLAPRKWKQRELGATITGKAVPFIIRRVRWFEKRSRPRLAGLFRPTLVHPGGRARHHRLHGAGAAIAPPFSGLDTLPALGVVTISLAIILEDAVVLGIGIVIGTGGIVLIVTIGAAIAHFIRDRF